MTETGAGRPVWPADSGPGGRGDDVAREAVLARAFVRLEIKRKEQMIK